MLMQIIMSLLQCLLYISLLGLAINPVCSLFMGRGPSLHRQLVVLHSTNKADLSSADLWRLKIRFKSFNNTQIQEASARVRFVPTKNYEPPQGRVFIEDDFNGLFKSDDNGYSGRWTLSEDKNDRKDGLWVWGLFEEPKYPFLYFNLGHSLKNIVMYLN